MTQTGAGPAAPASPAGSAVPAAHDVPALLAWWRERRPRYLALFAGDVVTLDVERGELAMAFEVGPQWGHVIGLQGGIVAGMLDSAMEQCLILCSGFRLSPPTLELKVSYLAPARPGAFRALGQVQHRGRSIAFARAELRDAKGALVATASATSRLMARDPEAPL